MRQCPHGNSDAGEAGKRRSPSSPQSLGWKRDWRPMKRAWIWFSNHGVLVLLVTAAVASLSVATASRPLGWLSRETATLWATGFAAAGTLAAVWAALRTANDAAVREARATKEATKREARATAEADQIRHDAVRPILSARVAWTNDDPYLLWITLRTGGWELP
jgi:hypothetical protein